MWWTPSFAPAVNLICAKRDRRIQRSQTAKERRIILCILLLEFSPVPPYNKNRKLSSGSVKGKVICMLKRYRAQLLSAFILLAALLACAGLHLSYQASQTSRAPAADYTQTAQ